MATTAEVDRFELIRVHIENATGLFIKSEARFFMNTSWWFVEMSDGSCWWFNSKSKTLLESSRRR